MVNLFILKTDELKTLVLYKNILESGRRFPKDFWTGEKTQEKGIKRKCRILTRYCLEDISHTEPSELHNYNLKQIKAMLIDGKLFGMVQIVFHHDILSLLRNAYPEEFRTKTLKDWMWSKHGIWHNDQMLIDAVTDMVYAEGIRRAEHIPLLDWKKRLLKHGIYNILMYFNWSIYSMFNFVYPNKFHPADFKYKTKWKTSKSLDNAFYYLHKTFKKNRYTIEQILLLSTSDFRKLGLTSMLISVFNSSTLGAKEYYLYKTLGDENHRREMLDDIKQLLAKKRDAITVEKLKAVAVDKYIYNLHSNNALYNYIKRQAAKAGVSIADLISRYGFIYKTDVRHTPIDCNTIWKLRKKGLTYVQIAAELNSNPCTIMEMCKKHFGGDPLIPRPIEDYITVQELMNKYRVDHKTVMKLAYANNIPSHTTIRLRYLKKSDIEPVLDVYVNKSKHHQFMTKRYQYQA